MILERDGVKLFYELVGAGPDVVCLHPYPSDHTFWLPAAQHWESRFRVVLPDLRGLGRSGAGDGVATMGKLAEDLLALCDALKIGRAVFIGCSVGGYILFEFWRRWRERVKALVLMDTRAGIDTADGIAARIRNADETLQKGSEWAIEQMIPRLLSPVTLSSHLDVVERARATMSRAGARGMSAMQRGMAERADSTATLASIDVPTLVLGGEDDVPSPVSEMQRLASGIPGAELRIIARAGHLAAFEQPEEAGKLVRDFLERNRR
jgi:pimeloyl-ACP methyl ester carboxylesterase